MTQRAIETLRTADLVLAEDTRKTRVLLDHFGIKARMVAAHAHNEAKTIPARSRATGAGRQRCGRDGRGHAAHLGPREPAGSGRESGGLSRFTDPWRLGPDRRAFSGRPRHDALHVSSDSSRDPVGSDRKRLTLMQHACRTPLCSTRRRIRVADTLGDLASRRVPLNGAASSRGS